MTSRLLFTLRLEGDPLNLLADERPTLGRKGPTPAGGKAFRAAPVFSPCTTETRGGAEALRGAKGSGFDTTLFGFVSKAYIQFVPKMEFVASEY